MVVLIFTIPGDFHTVAVRWGLERLGIEVVEFLTSDLPDQTSLAIDYTKTRTALLIDGRRFELDEIGVFWNRRLERPKAPEWVHEDDWDVLERECFELGNNARHLLSATVPTINPAGHQNCADRKVLQLHVARSIGMNVSPTVVGNDFESIEALRRSQETIHKPFRFFHWRADPIPRANYAAPTPMMTEDLRRSVESCPMIYQGLVKGQRDVRVACFGEVQIACLITRRQGAGSESLDIRQLMTEGATTADDTNIPPDLSQQIRQYMDQMGLLYAAFDFMIDEYDKWWFLECNESGQFLFIEYFLPSSNLLKLFCLFIARMALGRADLPMPDDIDISIAAFEASGGIEAIKTHQQAHKLSKQNHLPERFQQESMQTSGSV